MLFLNSLPISFLLEVKYQSDPQRSGKKTTAAAFATIVNVIKLGIPGKLHIKGENKHHAATK